MNTYVKKIYNSFVGVGAWAFLFIETILVSIRRPPSWTLILEQLFDIGVRTLPVVAITGLSTGMVLAAQSFYQLGDKGLADATGLFVGKSMLTEIGPVLTSFMVTGRVGSAMCAVLGTMRVTEQIDALKSMAVHPYRYLIAPRLIGCVVMLPLLTIFSGIIGIYGGYLVAVYIFNLPPQEYFDVMPGNIVLFDFLVGLIKALFFGIIISTISCYKGLTTTGGAAGVGRSITNSVVICYTYILITNFLLTVGLNSVHTYILQRFLIG